jgi:hypothetical protein
MATILTKKSDTASAVPLAGDLTNSTGGAELAVNTADKRLFTKTSGGTVVEVGTNPSSITTGTANATTVDTTNLEVTNIKAKDGTAAASIADSTGVFTHSTTTVFPAGAVGTPSITTAGDTNTGIYFPAADTIGFVEGGAEAMRIDSSGNVGIGTSSPAYKLHVVNTSGTTAAFRASTAAGSQIIAGNTAGDLSLQVVASGDSLIYSDTSKYLAFGTNGGTERMRLDSSGNLGIGTTSPAQKLEVNITSGSYQIRLGSGTTSALYTYDIGRSSADGYFRFYGNQTGANGYIFGGIDGERARIDTIGNVGIGTSSPATKLDIFSSSGTAAIKLQTAANIAYTINSQIPGVANNGFAIRDETNAVNRLVLDSSGNLGLGVTPSAWNASYKALQVNGLAAWSASGNDSTLSSNVYYDNAYRYRTTDTACMYVQFARQHQWFNAPSGTAGNAITFTQAMTLDASGNLGIGTSSPGYKLQVANGYVGILKSTGYGSSVDTGIDLGASNADSVNNSATYAWGQEVVGGASGQSLIFKAYRRADTTLERARIDSSGNFGVGRGTGGDTTVGATLYADGTVTCARSSSVNGDLNLYVYSTGAGAARFYVGMGGTVYATSTTITAISDARLKENIRDLDDGLNAVMALKPRKFDWKAGKGKDKKDDRGWIAQEFEQVFPDMVDTWADPAPEGEEPYKAINADLIPTLVKAIQEQQALIENLTTRLAALEAK